MIEHVVERCSPMLAQAFFSLIAVTEYEQPQLVLRFEMQRSLHRPRT